MPLGVNAHPDTWLDGVQVNANDLRLQTVAAHLTGASPSGSTGIAARPGVRYGTGNPLLVQASSGMSITVNAGIAWVQGTASATAGMYTCCLDTTATLTVATSDPTNPRIDNVICQVTDNGNNTSTTVVTLQTGTPAPSPVAPTLPANSLLLATVAVAAGVSSITAGNITDARAFTAATGGIVTMVNTTGGISGQAGLYAHDLSTGRLKVSDGSGNARQPKVAAFAAVSQQGGNNVATSTGSYTTLASVSITTDGSTEIEIYGSWLSLNTGLNSPGDFLNWQLTIDGTNVLPTVGQTFNGALGTGGSWRAWATPANGAHTVALLALSIGHAYGVNYPYIRVGPSLGQ